MFKMLSLINSGKLVLSNSIYASMPIFMARRMMNLSTKSGIFLNIFAILLILFIILKSDENFNVNDNVNEKIFEEILLRSGTKLLLNLDDFDDLWMSARRQVEINFDTFLAQGSEAKLKDFSGATLELYRYNPTNSGRYIPTPTALANKHAIVNIQSYDGKCLLYACAAKLMDQEMNDVAKEKKLRVQPWFYKKKIKTFNTKGIEFPTPLKQIRHAINKLDFNINIKF